MCIVANCSTIREKIIDRNKRTSFNKKKDTSKKENY